MTTTTTAPLTVTTAVALAAICTAAIGTQRVARATDHGDITYGTARSIGDKNGNFASSDDDIRDCYLRVTTDGGWEVFWPVSEILDDYRAGLFVPNYA